MKKKSGEDLVRFSVSIERELFEQFNRKLVEYGFSSRSEAVRDLIRTFLAEDACKADREVTALLMYVYDHHTREVVDKLIDVQHDFGEGIICTMHVHVDHRNCLEVAALKGNAKRLKELYSKIRSIRGVERAVLLPALPLAGD